VWSFEAKNPYGEFWMNPGSHAASKASCITRRPNKTPRYNRRRRYLSLVPSDWLQGCCHTVCRMEDERPRQSHSLGSVSELAFQPQSQ